MSVAQWRPLSSRLGDDPVRPSWREPVPAALDQPLRHWVYYTLTGSSSGLPRLPMTPGGAGRGRRAWHEVATDRLALRMNVVPPGDGGSDGCQRHLAYGTDTVMLVDVVDAILDLMPSSTDTEEVIQVPTGRRGQLQRLLDDALSVLRVREDGRGLERRADVMAEAAFEAAVQTAEDASRAGSAAEHLRRAWDCVHALHPDPGKAYWEAVKAVEAAAHAVLEPDKPTATLGTMLRQLRTHGEKKFSLAISGREGRAADVGRLTACVELLWKGETDRHGSMEPTPVMTLEEATMAVHLAVMLVQWFTSGAVWLSGT
jgi:hypothetical protein